jgi:ATP-binding cassette, subfamily B, bacterial MsbA
LSLFVKSELAINIGKLFLLLRLGGVRLWYLPFSALLAFFQSLMVMYSTFLLFPLAHGIINNDFTGVAHLYGLGLVVNWFPWLVKEPVRLFVFLILCIYVLSVVKNIFQYFSSLCTQTQARLATIRVRELLVVRCLGCSKNFHDRNTISYLQSVLARSTGVIETQFKALQRFISQTFILLAYLGVMVFISWQLTCLVLLFFPLITWMSWGVSRRISQIRSEYRLASLNFNEKIFNLLYCMPVVKSFAKEPDEIKKFSEASAQEAGQLFRIQRLGSLAAPLEDMGAMTGLLLVVLGLGWAMHSGRGIDPSSAFVFFYLAMRAMPELGAFGRFKASMAHSAAAVDDIEHVLNQPDSAMIGGGEEIFAGLSKEIRFKDLSFKYDDQGPCVLDGVDLVIEKGSVTAIVGPSGSGKTTLVSLLLRFYDCPPGSIFIDGRDIRELDITSLRRRIAFVSQEVLLFKDTLRNNIVYGLHGPAGEGFFDELAERLMIRDFADRMPQKYDTQVGARGWRLSGGERQRLSMARALIKSPDILIMDEAMSALDLETESRVNEFLAEASAGKTVIIIAHRLSTIKWADKVVLINKGRVVESGSMQELIEKKGQFHAMWQAQKL